MLDDVSTKHNVDARRTYLTGVSMGGHGVWSLFTSHPERFAAAAPVCAAGTTSDMAAIRGRPVWVFHGANDVIVPVSASDRSVEAAKQAGVDVSYTRYPQSPAPVGWPDYDGHASWIQAYSDEKLWAWMLSHSQGG